jgi:hypothetical protein
VNCLWLCVNCCHSVPPDDGGRTDTGAAAIGSFSPGMFTRAGIGSVKGGVKRLGDVRGGSVRGGSVRGGRPKLGCCFNEMRDWPELARRIPTTLTVIATNGNKARRV